MDLNPSTPTSSRIRTSSPTIPSLAEALARAQGAFQPIVKDKTAKVETRTGPGYSYAYSDLASALSAVSKALADNSLSVIQPVTTSKDMVTVTTRIMHASGEWLESDFQLPYTSGTPQATGSAVTYARRYSLLATLGVAPDDDDGAAAEQHAQASQRRQEARPAEPRRQAQQQRPAQRQETQQPQVADNPDAAAMRSGVVKAMHGKIAELPDDAKGWMREYAASIGFSFTDTATWSNGRIAQLGDYYGLCVEAVRRAEAGEPEPEDQTALDIEEAAADIDAAMNAMEPTAEEPVTVCREPDCVNLADGEEGYCSDHMPF